MIAFVVLASALIQLGSDGLYARAASPASLGANVPVGAGLAVYHALDRIAPLGFVEDALAHDALQRGNATLAERYANRMPDGPRRDDLFAQIASAHGDDARAFEEALSAADVDALQKMVWKRWNVNQADAFALELRVRDRVAALGTHPDAVAAIEYQAGAFASWMKRQDVAYSHMQAALAIAPFNVNYALSTANVAYLAGRNGDAAALYRRTLGINPAAGDAVAGLGLVALRRGDRAGARADLARAQSMPDHDGMTRLLERTLR